MRLTPVITSVLLLLGATGSKGGCYTPRTFSVVVDNGIRGAVLSYKLSSSNETRTVVFKGYNVSSSAVCGDKHQYCSLSSLHTSNGSIVVQVQLGRAIGVVLFDLDTFTLLDQVVVDIAGQATLNCEFTTLFTNSEVQREDILDLFGVCETQSLLYRVGYEVNVLNLTASSSELRTQPCFAMNRSRVLYFISPTFPAGVLVFVGQQSVYYYPGGSTDNCDVFQEEQVCSDVERFVGVPVFRDDGSTEAEKQAIYCPDVTHLIDVAMGDEFIVAEFSREADGYPMFYSDKIYCNLLGNELSLRYVSNKSTIMPEINFPYSDILQGDCTKVYDQYVAVILLVNSTVVIANLNYSNTTVLESSPIPPQPFGEAVLLGNSEQASVRSLRDSNFEDNIEGSPLLGLVIDTGNIDTSCPASTTSEPSTASGPSTTSSSRVPAGAIAGAVVGAVAGLVLLTLVIAVIVIVIVRLWWRHHQKKVLGRNPLANNVLAEGVQLVEMDGLPAKQNSSSSRSATPPSTVSVTVNGNGAPTPTSTAPSSDSINHQPLTTVTNAETTFNVGPSTNPPPSSFSPPSSTLPSSSPTSTAPTSTSNHPSSTPPTPPSSSANPPTNPHSLASPLTSTEPSLPDTSSASNPTFHRNYSLEACAPPPKPLPVVKLLQTASASNHVMLGQESTSQDASPSVVESVAATTPHSVGRTTTAPPGLGGSVGGAATAPPNPGGSAGRTTTAPPNPGGSATNTADGATPANSEITFVVPAQAEEERPNHGRQVIGVGPHLPRVQPGPRDNNGMRGDERRDNNSRPVYNNNDPPPRRT